MAESRASRLNDSLKNYPKRGIIPFIMLASMPADFEYNPLLTSAKQLITTDAISETSY